MSNTDFTVAKTSDIEPKIDAKIADLATYSYALCPYNHRVEVTSTKNWTVPDNIKNNEVTAFLVGAGGGGHSTYCGGAGGGGYTKLFKNIPVTAGEVIPITIGAGGAIASSGGYTQFKSSSYQASGGGAGGATYCGSGGSAGGGIASINSDRVYLNGAINGGCSGTATVIYGSSYAAVSSGQGQGSPTADPYSGIVYSAGGRATADVRSANKGKGGDLGGTGYDGICVIYYNTAED